MGCGGSRASTCLRCGRRRRRCARVLLVGAGRGAGGDESGRQLSAARGRDGKPSVDAEMRSGGRDVAVAGDRLPGARGARAGPHQPGRGVSGDRARRADGDRDRDVAGAGRSLRLDDLFARVDDVARAAHRLGLTGTPVKGAARRATAVGRPARCRDDSADDDLPLHEGVDQALEVVRARLRELDREARRLRLAGVPVEDPRAEEPLPWLVPVSAGGPLEPGMSLGYAISGLN